MRKHRNPSASLEREVILSVIILYVIICAVMLAIHYLQPVGKPTSTSSTSPAHAAPAKEDRP